MLWWERLNLVKGTRIELCIMEGFNKYVPTEKSVAKNLPPVDLCAVCTAKVKAFSGVFSWSVAIEMEIFCVPDDDKGLDRSQDPLSATGVARNGWLYSSRKLSSCSALDGVIISSRLCPLHWWPLLCSDEHRFLQFPNDYVSFFVWYQPYSLYNVVLSPRAFFMFR